MDDEKIVDLFWARDESAIRQTAAKYDNYLKAIAGNILQSPEDSEEAVSDTYLKAWNAIPPARPVSLQAYLGKAVRNVALDKYRSLSTQKRGSGTATLVFDEILGISDGRDLEEGITDRMVLKDVLEHFLSSLKTEERRIFLKRYWYFMSIRDIADEMSLGESKVKMTLLRCRGELKQLLKKEGFNI